MLRVVRLGHRTKKNIQKELVTMDKKLKALARLMDELDIGQPEDIKQGARIPVQKFPSEKLTIKDK